MIRRVRTMNSGPIRMLKFGPLGTSCRVRVVTSCTGGSDVRTVVVPGLRMFTNVRDVACRRRILRILGGGVGHVAMVLDAVTTLLLLVSVILVGGAVQVSVCSGHFVVGAVRLIKTAGNFVHGPFVHHTRLGTLVS